MSTDELLDHTPLTFGKYKGFTPDQVAAIDPAWLIWAYENVTDKATCSKLLYEACQEDDMDTFPEDSTFYKHD